MQRTSSCLYACTPAVHDDHLTVSDSFMRASASLRRIKLSSWRGVAVMTWQSRADPSDGGLSGTAGDAMAIKGKIIERKGVHVRLMVSEVVRSSLWHPILCTTLSSHPLTFLPTPLLFDLPPHPSPPSPSSPSLSPSAPRKRSPAPPPPPPTAAASLVSVQRRCRRRGWGGRCGGWRRMRRTGQGGREGGREC